MEQRSDQPSLDLKKMFLNAEIPCAGRYRSHERRNLNGLASEKAMENQINELKPVVAHIEPRLFTRPHAAAYCQCSLATFDSWVRRGLLPLPLPGTRRWDRRAIDAALDRASDLQSAAPDHADGSPLTEWRARRNARPS